jgi:hypothetical protein
VLKNSIQIETTNGRRGCVAENKSWQKRIETTVLSKFEGLKSHQ